MSASLELDSTHFIALAQEAGEARAAELTPRSKVLPPFGDDPTSIVSYPDTDVFHRRLEPLRLAGMSERDRRDRVRLIVAKHQGATMSDEDAARLEILNGRLRRVAPAVTKPQLDAISAALAEVEAID